MVARIYKQAAIYDARIIGMRNLWEPSTEFQGKKVDKPNYLCSIIVKKTRANWFEEPAFANFVKACQELYTASLSHIPFQQVTWPVKDGDVPDVGRAQTEWRMGNWLLTGSSTSPIEVSIVQGGVPIPLRNRAGVKPGDHVMVATAIAVKANDPRGVKVYINKVVFMAEGDEIVVGTGVSANELMEQAKAQGLNVTGYGGGGAPQQGFGLGATPGFVPPSAPPLQGTQTGFTSPPVSPSWGVDRNAPPPVTPPASPPNWGNVPPTGFPQR
jgi:Protein of unknown function (DUF2815)